MPTLAVFTVKLKVPAVESCVTAPSSSTPLTLIVAPDSIVPLTVMVEDVPTRLTSEFTEKLTLPVGVVVWPALGSVVVLSPGVVVGVPLPLPYVALNVAVAVW